MPRRRSRSRPKVDYAKLHKFGTCSEELETCTSKKKTMSTKTKAGTSKRYQSEKNNNNDLPSAAPKKPRFEGPMTVSKGYRLQGNECYSLANKPGVSKASQEANLQKALNSYYRAIQTSDSPEEMSEYNYTCLCPGDGLLSQVVSNEEELNLDLVWEVIDWYKNAILLTREKEVEFEAIAWSRMGRVYNCVLKLNSRAKDCFMRCMQLAGSLHPRTFNEHDWYRECATTLEQYQKEKLEEEENRHQKEREKFLKELKNELDKLAAKAEEYDDKKLLEYVYTIHPPKNSKHKMKKPKNGSYFEHTEKKKAFQQGIVHYHPDKQDVEKHGMTWKVLCEEITKRLTCVYERLK